MKKTKPHSEPTRTKGQRVRLQTSKLRQGALAETEAEADGPTALRANVILRHCLTAARGRRLALDMLQEVEASSRVPVHLRDLSLGIDAMVAGGKVPPNLLTLSMDALSEATELDGRASMLSSLAGTLTHLAAIEHGAADSIRAVLTQHVDRLLGMQAGPRESDLAKRRSRT